MNSARIERRKEKDRHLDLLEQQEKMLRFRYFLESVGEDLKVSGLDEADYVLVGGAFPIRLENSEQIVAVAVCSNLFHVLDHEFITGSLREFLDIPAAPAYPWQPGEDA